MATAFRVQSSITVQVAGLICALVGALVYINTLDCRFCFDDDEAIEHNPDLLPNVSWTNLLWDDFWGTPMHDKDSHKSYRPLTVATFRLNYLLHALQPMGYHLVNVLLHSAVCYLYVQLCGVVFSAVWPALIAGLLFAVHPIHTEAVAGLVGRADVLAGLFFVGAILVYIKMISSEHGQNHGKLVVSLILCLCSALSKEIGITAVAIFVVYEFFILNKMDLPTSLELLKPKKLPKWFVPFLLRAVALVIFVVTFLILRVKLNQGRPIFSINNNPAMAFKTPYRQLHWSYLVFFNIWLLLNPSHLCAEYAMGTIPAISSFADPRNLLTLVTFTVITFLGLYSVSGHGRHQKVVLFSLSLMVFPFIPASNLFFPVGFVIAERILYLPSMGFCMLVGWGAWNILKQPETKATVRLIVKVGLIYLLLFHAAKAIARNRHWQWNLTLYSSAVKFAPNNGKMFSNLATVYDINGNRSFAETLFKQAVEVEPTYVTAYMNLGYILRGENRTMEAIEAYQTGADLVTNGLSGGGVHITPKNIKVYNSLSNLLRDHTDHIDDAYHYAEEAVRWEPEWENAHNTKGNALMKFNRVSEAKREFEEAIRLNPEFSVAYSNLGDTLEKLKDYRGAEENYRKCLAMDPDHTLTKFRLAGLVIQRMQNPPTELLLEAKQLLQDVISVEPENGNATLSLGLIYYDLKDSIKAEEFFRRTLEITPDDVGTLYNLAMVLSTRGQYSEAVEPLLRLLELDPDHLNGLSQLATCYLQKKETKKAREMFEVVLEKDPSHLMSLQNLGLAMIYLHEYDEAIRLFTQVVQLNPANEPAQRQLQELHKYKLKEAAKDAQATSTTHNSLPQAANTTQKMPNTTQESVTPDS